MQLPTEITERLYHFYPVGLSNFLNYDGQQELNDIVARKIDLECNDDLSDINRFFTSMSSIHRSFVWENISYLHFPNYIVDCLIEEEEVKNINHQFRLQICISMLCDFYTVFCIDRYGFRGVQEVLPFDAVYEICSFENSRKRLPHDLLYTLEIELSKTFPKKKFFSHLFLMNNKVTGTVPYKRDPSIYSMKDEYSIYQLMFHDDFASDRRILQ